VPARAPRGERPLELTRELIALYLLAPLLTTPVMQGDFFDSDRVAQLRSLAVNVVAFLTIPAGIHLLYRFVMPPLLDRVRARAGRALLHVVMSALAAAAVAWLVSPVVDRVDVDDLDLGMFIFRSVAITWGFVLPTLFVQALRRRAAEAERRMHEQRQAALRAQLEAIQSRANPHFLFNAMNTVASLIQDDPALAERTVERLAEVLRYALQSSRRERVALIDELATVRGYLEIQRARFGDRLRFTIDVDPGLDRVEVPPLLLQPLIENAIRHGVEGRTGTGSIAVAVRRRGDRIELEVDDDGPGAGRSPHRGTGTSLQDLARRLELMYGASASLAVRSNAARGFGATLALPVWTVSP
jgi:two-component system sensor histidine kinase AlgZ